MIGNCSVELEMEREVTWLQYTISTIAIVAHTYIVSYIQQVGDEK